MKVLLVSLVKRKVAPEVTAARPRMIYELAKGLLKRGHQVTLLATGDSHVSGADIIPAIPVSLVDLPVQENPFYVHTSFLVRLAKKLEEVASQFDIIHNHTYPEFINLLAAEKLKIPMVTTIHAQGTPEFDEVLSLFPKSYLVSISNAHRRLFKKARISKVIYNGIDTDLCQFKNKNPHFAKASRGRDDYLLWLGRLSKAKDEKGEFLDPKGVKWAIKLAQATGEKLVISGNVEDKKFFEKEVKPHLNDKIKWFGPISSEQILTKEQVVGLMQGAKAFLMTINWYEPFGLVMAEAMSCGTPVIGFDRGSVSEIVRDGVTGFVVKPEKKLEGLKEALSKINQINPKDCREHVVNNFSVEKMVENYEKVYKEILKRVNQ